MNIKLSCNNCNTEFLVEFKQRDKKFCNRKCYFDYARKNNLIGKQKDDSTREKRICIQCGETFIERKKYKRKLCSIECRTKWNNNPKNISDRIDKSKKSVFEKYGVDTLFKKESFQKSLRDQFLKRHGVSHPMLKKEFVDKLKNTLKLNHLPILLDKLKLNDIELIDDYVNNKDGNSSRVYNFKCLKCDNIFTSTLLGSGKIPICRKCFPITKNSSIEHGLRDFLNKYHIEHIDGNRKILKGKEIDLFIPSKNIGFEINGNYFHSEIHGGKNKNYHIDKTIDANEENIKLIHILEDEIKLKKNIVFSRLKNILGITSESIYARKGVIKEINKKDSIKFLNDNHIQGTSIDKIRLGLYYNEELVSIMTFGGKRKSLGNKNIKNSEYEIVRFCNKLDTNVVGSFSKLLKHFIREYNPTTIITYADIRWSGINPEKTVYHKNGFKYVENTPPNYWYVNTSDFLNRHHRFNYRKDVLVKEGYNKENTEWEIMRMKGFDRIWDCGSMKFVLDIDSIK
jgi:hypothetical protein